MTEKAAKAISACPQAYQSSNLPPKKSGRNINPFFTHWAGRINFIRLESVMITIVDSSNGCSSAKIQNTMLRNKLHDTVPQHLATYHKNIRVLTPQKPVRQ